MDPNNAPYKCPCGSGSWNKDDFYTHLKDCPEAYAFLKITKQLFEHYRKLSKYLVNPEDYV